MRGPPSGPELVHPSGRCFSLAHPGSRRRARSTLWPFWTGWGRAGADRPCGRFSRCLRAPCPGESKEASPAAGAVPGLAAAGGGAAALGDLGRPERDCASSGLQPRPPGEGGRVGVAGSHPVNSGSRAPPRGLSPGWSPRRSPVPSLTSLTPSDFHPHAQVRRPRGPGSPGPPRRPPLADWPPRPGPSS